jgi:hypothetical protein
MSFGNWLWLSRRRQLLSAGLKIMASAVLFERQPLLLVGDELCLSPLNKSTAMCLEGCMPFDRPFHVPQGGFCAVAVNVVNGGRDQIVINESAEGPPGVVDQIDRVVVSSGNSFSSKRGVRTVLGPARVRKSPFLALCVMASHSAASPAVRSVIAEPLSAPANLQCGDLGRVR